MAESVADEVVRQRQARTRAGTDLCRAAIAEVATARGLERAAEEALAPLSGSDLILARARQRAAGERRAQRITG